MVIGKFLLDLYAVGLLSIKHKTNLYGKYFYGMAIAIKNDFKKIFK